jgi:hypothetical protein
MTQTAERPEQVDEVVEADEPRFLQPPSACGTEFEQVDWVGTIAIHIREQLYVGLRFNDRGVQEAVTRALGDRVVEGLETVAYYSLKIGTPGRRKKTPMHYLYLGNRPIVGTRDVGRLIAGLSAQLSFILAPPEEGYVLYAVPVMTPAGLLLVPGEISQMANVVDRVLDGEDFRFADVPAVGLDAATGQVVVPASSVPLEIDADTLADLGPSASEGRLEPGSYPLAGWLMAVGADDAGPLRHAKAVLYGTRMLNSPFPHGAQAAVDDIARIVKDLPVAGVSWASEDELVGAVLEAGRSAG